MKHRDVIEARMTITRAHELLECGIFDQQNAGHPLQRSAFIELMIVMRDLLAKAESLGQRINFSDDVEKNGYVKDVTDAITAARDACCHINSFKKSFGDSLGYGDFLVAYGRGGLVKFGDFAALNPYHDDTAIYFGRNRILLNRHVRRALSEAEAVLQPAIAGGA